MSRGKKRFLFGAVVLVASFCAPALIPLVVISGLPTGWKASLSGLLAAGIPEIGMIAGVAIMGKEGFAHFKQLLKRLLAPLAPSYRVHPRRYRIGLVLFLIPLVLAWIGPYAGHLLPGYDDYEVAYAVSGDVLLIASLFILGGEFWEKLRALFRQDLRVVSTSTADS